MLTVQHEAVTATYMKDPEKSCERNREGYMKDLERVVLTVEHEAVKVTRVTWRRVAMIVLHGVVSIGVRTGGLEGQCPPNICHVLRTLQL